MIYLKSFFLIFIFGLLACGNKSAQIDNLTNKTGVQENNFSLKLEKSGGDIMEKPFRYTLIIEPNGKVIFNGIENTATKGKSEDILNQEKMNKLSDEINRADFLSLKNLYTSASDNCPTVATDSGNIIISIKLNDCEKTIHHYLGCIEKNGKIFPQQLYNLENKIDEIVETKRWIGERK